MDELIEKLVAALIELIESGEDVPDEVIEQVTDILMGRIQSLSSERPIDTASQETQNLTPTEYPSSNINSFKFDPITGKLLVKFMGKDQANAGPIYAYEGVPPYIFDILRRGSVGPKTSGSNRWHTWKKGILPSHGAAMAALIKAGNFPYKKVA